MPLFVKDLACRDAVELVTDYLEGALTRRQRRRFEFHLLGCPNCREYLDQIRAAMAVTGDVTPEDLDPAAKDELIALFRRYREN